MKNNAQHTILEMEANVVKTGAEQCNLPDVVGRSEQLSDKGEYCNRCGDYVGDGCDNTDCKDFKG